MASGTEKQKPPDTFRFRERTTVGVRISPVM
jgi:hypothetical protein